MRKLYFLLAFFISFVLLDATCSAQNGVITTICGTGEEYTYSGDNGPAVLAPIDRTLSIAIDALGNIYFTDGARNVIRKINSSGIITTIAGTGLPGYTGDGGPATAAKLSNPYGLTTDKVGNIYFCDNGNYVVRKISRSGIITTVAGNGISGYSGDGGQATAAQLNPMFITLDLYGNIYTAEYKVIRKIDTSGIIKTVAGNYALGTGYSGDGGSATAAQFYAALGISVDAIGNLYIADAGNSRIRKVSVGGTITTIAGGAISGYSGDGGPATAAGLNSPDNLCLDNLGNIYIADYTDNRIRKVSTSGIISTVAGNGRNGFGLGAAISDSGDFGNPLSAVISGPTAVAIDAGNNIYIGDLSNKIRKVFNSSNSVSDSFNVYLEKLCDGIHVSVLAEPSATKLLTYFGDGISDISLFTDTGAAKKELNLEHSYQNNGTYTVKHVLYCGSMPVDSVKYSYESKLCNTVPVKFYYDANGNSIKDTNEAYFTQPVTIEVDSNGTVINTLSATSGMYYTAYGNTGDIYTFRVLSAPTGFVASYPVSGVITDTIQAQDNSQTKYVAFTCGTPAGFDLSVNSTQSTGRHVASGSIIVGNSNCAPENATVTLQISPKYIFASAFPHPSTIAGNLITWKFSDLSVLSPQYCINYTLILPTTTWLVPGDTANEYCTISPTSGDIDTMNNYSKGNDTIRSSFDPNEMTVMPQGYTPSGQCH